eukprot:scaffold71515_cov32-Tisochrysis_lutea.AAC.4
MEGQLLQVLLLEVGTSRKTVGRLRELCCVRGIEKSNAEMASGFRKARVASKCHRNDARLLQMPRERDL